MQVNAFLVDFVSRFWPGPCGKRPEWFLDIPTHVLNNSQCFKALLSLALGYGIVLFACIIKIPQIIRLWRTQSAEGMSRGSILIESFAYSYNLAAHYRQGFHISTYGDFASILIQNLIILVMTYIYDSFASLLMGLITAGALVLLTVLLCTNVVPITVVQFLTGANALVAILSRGPQIWKNYQDRSTGQLSIVTCTGIWLGSLARIFTTLQNVPSMNILVGYVVSSTCNMILVWQILLYRTKPTAIDRSKED
mmetsp:Transcript_17301/g.35936  ORF Transcript_17301/g.35936 Transcript_17301/m.35936 type:complete len:252 (-) Transcript_17301:1522-2277(-)|eukprot:CAMPEP_0184679414 /NCGR_PEP_ID=MMETSP0312-20130426/2244_1 /TAXON_ID=31354 /ORGANISM="Compsopogon coeruleus, Strain SAG 36.94" /LENGTH=251 /DNA_ID=CAMNT_0027128835 /DNA_START=53 /DNA_END=808 /DNA_ORIENTATION=+